MDSETRKIALRMFTYGVYILTSKMGSEISASTVTWVSQASFDPPMLSVCIKRNSGSYKLVKERGEFLLHILGNNQKDLAATFFKRTEVEINLINGVQYELLNDLPCIPSTPAHLHCYVQKIIEEGDHPLFLSTVNDVAVREKNTPLELRKTGWSYGG